MSVTATDRPANERRVPGPRGLKLWGLVPQLVSRPHECLLELVRQYGDIVMMSTPVETAVLVANPDYMEHLFHANHKNYDKQTPRWGTLRQLWGNGLLTADGDLWRRQRQRIQPAFHQECLQNFAAIAVEESRKMASEWTVSAGTPRDVYPDMLHIAVRTVVRATFSADIEGKTDLLIRAVGDTHRRRCD